MGSSISSGFGSQGPQGPQGPPGPQGPAGLSGLQDAIMITSTTTWTCPADVTKVWVSMVGGGAGGGSGNVDNSTGQSYTGGGGGSGWYIVNYAIPVVPATVYNITIGAGGTGNIYYQHPQANIQGGTTSFGALVSVAGGWPGQSSSGLQGSVFNTWGGSGGMCGEMGSEYYKYDQWIITTVWSLGVGGSSPFGTGGIPAHYSAITGQMSSTPSTGYGSGGHGGYGTFEDVGGTNSGNGRDGCCIIMY